ncbi:unnamed protein product [Staurois parvus]|uniref:Protein kinase domain-containing protein n=1 Tax=Staurois parvus TaxID=386267 RepID=A0ABN9C7K9_9NEOB|nr:unnamed protein product [Staurois parvus]
MLWDRLHHRRLLRLYPELAPVGDLFSLIIPHVGIEQDAVKRCAVQMSDALEFISERGLVHLDIKPENILVFDWECHCIKLTDFGLTKVKGTVTRKCGTTSFMAPEMCKAAMSDGLAVDSSLDVWAFGVVIFSLLTGEMPWQEAILDDADYKSFVNWQNNFQMEKPPDSWRRIPIKLRRMFGDLLAIDHTERCHTTEVIKYIDVSWKRRKSTFSYKERR